MEAVLLKAELRDPEFCILRTICTQRVGTSPQASIKIIAVGTRHILESNW